MKPPLTTLLTLLTIIPIYMCLTCNSERIELEYYNPKYWSHVSMETFPFNRTLRLINITLSLIKTIDVASVNFKSYALIGNRYVLTAMQATLDMRQVISYSFFGFKKIFVNRTTPPINKWPMVPGNYQITNVMFDDLPEAIPSGRYKMGITMYRNKEDRLLVFDYYLKAVH